MYYDPDTSKQKTDHTAFRSNKNTERNNAAPTYTGFILISVDFSCEKFCPRRTTPNVSIMIARNKKILFHIFGLYSYVS